MNQLVENVKALNLRTTNINRRIHQLNYIGDYKWSCRSNDFHGWLKCDGRSMDITAQCSLYNIIGTTFGSNSDTTFKLPDFQGRVMGAVSSSHNFGTFVGTETATLDVTQIPSHNHNGTTNTSGSHSHNITDLGHTHTQTTINDDFNGSGGNPPGFVGDSTGSHTWNNINSSTTGISINNNGDHVHTFTSGNTGGGLPHNNMQPTLFAGNVFIYSGIFE